MTDLTSEPSLKEQLQRRKGTRLMVVQALYQRAQTGVLVEDLEHHFFEGPFNDYFVKKGILGDSVYFGELVRGVTLKQEEIDAWISQFLTDGWRIERLETIVLAILRAGVYELWAMRDVPAPLIINEYVSLAHGFFEGKEPRFVNAVLDKVSSLVRTTP